MWLQTWELLWLHSIISKMVLNTEAYNHHFFSKKADLREAVNKDNNLRTDQESWKST